MAWYLHQDLLFGEECQIFVVLQLLLAELTLCLPHGGSNAGMRWIIPGAEYIYAVLCPALDA